ncbi:MAG: type IV toxin-antitoxin system AbiEi family antitoxin domain-containing protein [Deltaproteobacteria bacterium]|nr:type IV toxin-antitoxin system AbiEi family antitoxin domain-containing protein [Deltaproteobacteria bacterium]
MEVARPDWNRLYETASSQQGLFTTKQAEEAGYSPQLLNHHIHTGRVTRLRRGVYRIVHFPAGEHEDLVAAWLWSEQAGIVSHQTALALHDLSDLLPGKIHLTLPSSWRARRFRVPAGVVLHYADVPADDRKWFGATPITGVQRTLNDCAKEALSADLLRQAAQQALRRGLVTRRELGDVEDVLKPFGGIAPHDGSDLQVT